MFYHPPLQRPRPLAWGVFIFQKIMAQAQKVALLSAKQISKLLLNSGFIAIPTMLLKKFGYNFNKVGFFAFVLQQYIHHTQDGEASKDFFLCAKFVEQELHISARSQTDYLNELVDMGWVKVRYGLSNTRYLSIGANFLADFSIFFAGNSAKNAEQNGKKCATVRQKMRAKDITKKDKTKKDADASLSEPAPFFLEKGLAAIAAENPISDNVVLPAKNAADFAKKETNKESSKAAAHVVEAQAVFSAFCEHNGRPHVKPYTSKENVCLNEILAQIGQTYKLDFGTADGKKQILDKFAQILGQINELAPYSESLQYYQKEAGVGVFNKQIISEVCQKIEKALAKKQKSEQLAVEKTTEKATEKPKAAKLSPIEQRVQKALELLDKGDLRTLYQNYTQEMRDLVTVCVKLELADNPKNPLLFSKDEYNNYLAKRAELAIAGKHDAVEKSLPPLLFEWRKRRTTPKP